MKRPSKTIDEAVFDLDTQDLSELLQKGTV